MLDYIKTEDMPAPMREQVALLRLGPGQGTEARALSLTLEEIAEDLGRFPETECLPVYRTTMGSEYTAFDTDAATVIQGLGAHGLGVQVGDHEARVGALGQVLGLGDHPPGARPTLAGAITQLPKPPGGQTRLHMASPGLAQRLRNPFLQPLIARQAQQVTHAIGLAPTHYLLSAKPRISPYIDAYVRPALPNLTDNPCQLRHTARRRIIVRRAQPRT